MHLHKIMDKKKLIYYHIYVSKFGEFIVEDNMHIPDGFLSNNLAGGLLCGALTMLGYCLERVYRTVTAYVGITSRNSGNTGVCTFGFSDDTSEYLKKLTIIAMWVFASQMFNIPIQSTTSAHLIGGVFAAVIAGPFGGFLIMSLVLSVQSLFFADGGILALGANIFNMAFIGSFVSYYVYKALSGKNYYVAISTACLFSVLTAALFCLIELSISGVTPFSASFKDMMSMHAIVAVLETIITLGLLWLLKLTYK